MKKTLVLGAILVGAVSFCSNAYAEETDSTTNEENLTEFMYSSCVEKVKAETQGNKAMENVLEKYCKCASDKATQNLSEEEFAKFGQDKEAPEIKEKLQSITEECSMEMFKDLHLDNLEL